MGLGLVLAPTAPAPARPPLYFFLPFLPFFLLFLSFFLSFFLAMWPSCDLGTELDTDAAGRSRR